MSDQKWNDEVDVVVVGLGGAGASAAIEAVDRGSSVLCIERFYGGGATKRSGGIVYAGGGTPYQKAAGFEDTLEDMYNYLKMEARGVVKDETVKAFCNENIANLDWLEQQGVCFDSKYCPTKTSYPPQDYYLYYSGNEPFPPYNAAAKPAPRGHRAAGSDMLPGPTFFKALQKSAVKKGVDVRCRAKAKALITDKDGKVIGVEYKALSKFNPASLAYRVTVYLDYKTRYMQIAWAPFTSVFKAAYWLMEKTGRKKTVRARQGVILASGGFVFNRKMIKKYAPKYTTGVPLGSVGDDGSGIEMGIAVGADTGQMHRVSAWRFITPPEATVKGIVVDLQGQRFCNEQLYGARMSEYMIEEHGAKAKLIVDKDLRNLIRDQSKQSKIWWFQKSLVLIDRYINRKKGKSIEKLAKKCGIPQEKLRATVDAYNEMVRKGGPDPFGKASEHLQPIVNPPFYAVDISLKNMWNPLPTLTLGGLVVDESTCQVKRKDGSVIDGLYAVGRTSVGFCSRGYISGMALAHCVWSGRHAAQHATARKKS